MLILALALLLGLWTDSAFAACGGSGPLWLAASPESSDILDCHALASDGDTILTGTGTATGWTATTNITKAVTIEGAGQAFTTVQDNVSSGELLKVTLVANKLTTIKGIKFTAGSRSSPAGVGIVAIEQGTSTVDGRRFRITDCEFDQLNGVSVSPRRVYGLIDHSTFTMTGTNIGIYFLWVADYVWPDDRWAASSPDWGSDNFVFIEDSSFSFPTGTTYAIIDSYGGARFVFRYNTVTRGYVEVHGTESASRSRGGVAVEVYNNTFDNTNGGATGNTYLGLRSGTALVYGNSGTNWTELGSSVALSNLRDDYPFKPWGPVDGRNPWDKNDPTNPQVTGTATSAGTRTMTDSTKSWVTDEWIGATLRKLAAPCNVPIAAVNTSNEQLTVTGHGLSTGDTIILHGHSGSTPHLQGEYVITVVDTNTITLDGVDITTAGSGGWVSLLIRSSTFQPVCNAQIVSNTPTQLTYFFGLFSNDMVFAASDAYEINWVDGVLDQPGVIGGTNLNGVTNPVPPTYDQVISKVYEWDNVKDVSTDLDVSVNVPYSTQIVSGTHYENDTVAPGYTARIYPHPNNDGGGGGGSSPKRFSPSLIPVSWPIPYVNQGVSYAN